MILRLAVLAAWTAFPLAAHAQDSLRIAERVGTVLDANERAYFGLFPRVSAFERAAFFAEGDSVRMEVKREALPDTILRIPAATAAVLGRYIDAFEAEGERLVLENAPLLVRLVRYPHTYRDPSTIAFRMRSGQRRTVAVLQARPEGLLVSPHLGAYAWREASDAEWFAPSSLAGYTAPVRSGRSVVQGMGSGVLVGGALLATGGLTRENIAVAVLSAVSASVAGLLSNRRVVLNGQAERYAVARRDLAAAAAFRETLPPELTRSATSASPAEAGEARRPRGGAGAWLRPPSWVYLSVSGGELGYTRAEETGTFRYLESPRWPAGNIAQTKMFVAYPNGLLRVSAGATPVRFVYMGADVAWLSPGKMNDFSYQSLSGREVLAVAGLRLSAPPSASTLLQRFTVLADYGRGNGNYRSQGYYPVALGTNFYYTGQNLPDFEDRLDRRRTLPIRMSRVGVQVRLNPLVSLHGQYTRVHSDERLNYDLYSNNYRVGTASGFLISESGFNVDISRSSVELGVTYHF